jgi:hypothetical protein
MGNGPFLDGLPIKKGWIFHGYVSHNQMVNGDFGVYVHFQTQIP